MTGAGQLWTLNAAAVTALTVFLEGGTLANALRALELRWPNVPRDQLSADLDACLAPLRDAGVIP